MTKLNWLIGEPTRSSVAGLTAYREEFGENDLFSVFVKFKSSSSDLIDWDMAEIYALVEEMEYRLPGVGGRLVLTAGLTPVAIAEVI